MKFFNIILIFSMVLAFSGCSKSAKTEQDESSPQATTESADSDFISEAEGTATEATQEATAVVEEKAAEAQDIVQEAADETAVAADANALVEEENKVTVNTNASEYKVEKGETMMLVAFKLFGDYRKWKELAQMNPQLKGMRLLPGTPIKFNPPAEKFVWSPKGDPYLIKLGDTLGIISKEKYGSVRKWKDLWENNRPLIRDPNLIFAGFTIYAIPDSKTVASVE